MKKEIKKELPSFIKRSLTHGIVILPCFLEGIMIMNKRFSIPDEVCDKFNKKQIEKYVQGLKLSSMEMASHWTKGHELLKELGFKEEVIEQGHRSFINLKYKEKS